jgi:hypothetical protein
MWPTRSSRSRNPRIYRRSYAGPALGGKKTKVRGQYRGAAPLPEGARAVLRRKRKKPMAEHELEPEQKREPIPIMQRILEDPFLLLLLGLVTPTVFYILWGIMNIVTIPVSQ